MDPRDVLHPQVSGDRTSAQSARGPPRYPSSASYQSRQTSWYPQSGGAQAGLAFHRIEHRLAPRHSPPIRERRHPIDDVIGEVAPCFRSFPANSAFSYAWLRPYDGSYGHLLDLLRLGQRTASVRALHRLGQLALCRSMMVQKSIARRAARRRPPERVARPHLPHRALHVLRIPAAECAMKGKGETRAELGPRR